LDGVVACGVAASVPGSTTASAPAGAPAVEQPTAGAGIQARTEVRLLLSVCGVDEPSDEISHGLVNHVREKLEELTTARLGILLPRIAHTRVSTADLRFLRPVGAPPLATALLPLPRTEPSRTRAEWMDWLRACGGWLRAGGWCPLTHAPLAEAEVLTLLHVPPRSHNSRHAHKDLICVFASLEAASQVDVSGGGGSDGGVGGGVVVVGGGGGGGGGGNARGDAGEEPWRSSELVWEQRVRVLGHAEASDWSLRLRAWGRGPGVVEGAVVVGSPSGPDPQRSDGPAAQLVEALCSAFASRLIEAEVIEALDFVLAALPRTSAAGISISPVAQRPPSPVLTQQPNFIRPSSAFGFLTGLPSLPRLTPPLSDPLPPLVRRVAFALCAASAAGSSATSRMTRPLLMPRWALRRVAHLVCRSIAELMPHALAPYLVCATAAGDDFLDEQWQRTPPSTSNESSVHRGQEVEPCGEQSSAAPDEHSAVPSASGAVPSASGAVPSASGAIGLVPPPVRVPPISAPIGSIGATSSYGASAPADQLKGVHSDSPFTADQLSGVRVASCVLLLALPLSSPISPSTKQDERSSRLVLLHLGSALDGTSENIFTQARAVPDTHRIYSSAIGFSRSDGAGAGALPSAVGTPSPAAPQLPPEVLPLMAMLDMQGQLTRHAMTLLPRRAERDGLVGTGKPTLPTACSSPPISAPATTPLAREPSSSSGGGSGGAGAPAATSAVAEGSKGSRESSRAVPGAGQGAVPGAGQGAGQGAGTGAVSGAMVGESMAKGMPRTSPNLSRTGSDLRSELRRTVSLAAGSGYDPNMSRTGSKGDVHRDVMPSQSNKLASASSALLHAGKLHEAAESVLRIAPRLHTWRRPLLLVLRGSGSGAGVSAGAATDTEAEADTPEAGLFGCSRSRSPLHLGSEDGAMSSIVSSLSVSPPPARSPPAGLAHSPVEGLILGSPPFGLGTAPTGTAPTVHGVSLATAASAAVHAERGMNNSPTVAAVSAAFERAALRQAYSELSSKLVLMVAERLAERLSQAGPYAAHHCPPPATGAGAMQPEGAELGDEAAEGVEEGVFEGPRADATAAGGVQFVLARRRRCISLLRLSTSGGGVRCAVHLLGSPPLEPRVRAAGPSSVVPSVGLDARRDDETVSVNAQRDARRDDETVSVNAQHDANALAAEGAAAAPEGGGDGMSEPSRQEIVDATSHESRAAAAGAEGDAHEDEEEDEDEDEDTAEDAAPEVKTALEALYYDAHVALCLPSAADESAVLVDEGGEGGAASRATLGGASVDSVTSLRALLASFSSPPLSARCIVLEGEANGPLASHAQLLGYLSYLKRHAGAAAGAMGSSGGGSSGGGSGGVGSAGRSGSQVLTFTGQVRILPCGSRGSMGFRLPEPHEGFECVAWLPDGSSGGGGAAEPAPPAGCFGSAAHTSAPSGSAVPGAGAQGGSAVPAEEEAGEGRASPVAPPEPTPGSRFSFFLVGAPRAAGAAAGGAAGAAARARDEAGRLLERALSERWAAYRSYLVWTQLQRGDAPPVSELMAFLKALPVAVELDTIYPSLRSLRSLPLPWSALLLSLARLPLRSCRWHDGKREHLILLQRDPAPASAPASVHAGAAGAGAGAAATACTGGVHGGALASVGGVHGGSIWCSDHLVHCEVRSSGTELRLRACSTRPLTETSELSSELTEVVANAIACWAWAAASVPTPPSF
jgi:hypothetical protein